MVRPRTCLVLALLGLGCGDVGSPSATSELRFVALSAGDGHSCGHTDAGATYCWGENMYGQLGAETGVRENPVPLHIVVRPLELTRVSAGSAFSCGLLNTGVALCWGADDSSPRQLRGASRLLSISAGEFICGVREDQAVFCWDTPDAEPRAVESPGLTQVEVGGLLACGLAGDGAAWCWPREANAAQPVPGGLTFTDITAGRGHACGIHPSRMAYCWGQNGTGQLGNLNFADESAPDTVKGGWLWTQLSAGLAHTCGITTAGGAFCWGSGGNGQLGYNGTVSFRAPVRVRGEAVPETMLWSAIAAGGLHSCGSSVDGLTLCWGENGSGQLGNGSTEPTLTPVPIGPGE